MTMRRLDTHAEYELSLFLDENFYLKLVGKYPAGDYFWKRVREKEEQLRGIDGVLTSRGRTFFIDEKAALHYINQDLKTFAFEINSYQHGQLTEGWLFSDKCETTHYLLIWPRTKGRKNVELGEITQDDFDNCDCVLIARDAVIKLLQERGLTKDRIEEDAQRLRSQGCLERVPILDSDGRPIKDCHYYLSGSKKYEEAPFNVLINRKTLEERALYVVRCTASHNA